MKPKLTATEEKIFRKKNFKEDCIQVLICKSHNEQKLNKDIDENTTYNEIRYLLNSSP